MDRTARDIGPDDSLHRIPAPLLPGLPIVRHFDGERHLTRDIAQALHYLLLHPGDPLPGAWLRGDSLPQDELDRLHISTREIEDRDPEDRARETVLALARFAGARYSPRWYRRPAVLFPIRDQDGTLVAVSGRFISERNAAPSL